jgi:hypothetical protein
MGTATLSREEISRRADELYERSIRRRVETPENIGTMVIMDIDTEEYEVDELGIVPARHLQARNPNAVLFGKRIGYDVADAIGGTMERTAP